jgi:Na+/proline symporter
MCQFYSDSSRFFATDCTMDFLNTIRKIIFSLFLICVVFLILLLYNLNVYRNTVNDLRYIKLSVN